MADDPAPELWSTRPEAVQLLGNILANPHADHVPGVAQLSLGVLREAHVAGIVRALEGLEEGTTPFPNSFTTNAGAALHTVLYHLLGGADQNLPPPPSDTSRDEIKRCSAGWSTAKPDKDTFFRKLAKAKAKADGGDALRALRGAIFAPVRHKNLRRPDADPALPQKTSITAATVRQASGSAPAPDPADPAEAELRRRAACCLALAMGTHDRLGMQSRVHRLHGQEDVFRLISKHAELRTTEWFARPLPKELPTLRRHLRLEYGMRMDVQGQLDDERVRSRALERERDEAIRRADWADTERRAARRREMAQHQENDARLADALQAVSGLEKKLRRELTQELTQRSREEERWLTEQWMEAKETLQKFIAEEPDRRRAQDAEMRDERCRLSAEREEKAAEAAELAEQVEQLQLQLQQLEVALQRVRETSKAGLLQQVTELQQKVRDLGARRKANQLKVIDANLARRATAVAQQQLQKERTVIRDFIGTGLDYAARAKQIEADNTVLLEKLKSAQADLKAAQREAAKYRAVAEPGKAKFFQAGHFSAAVDQIIIECLSLGVARNKLPQLFIIFARFYGILIPGRQKKVPGPWVDGRRTTVERYVYYLPGKSHVKEMAAVMNQLNKLQMGEWLLQHIESDETSCCYLADGAESQQVDYLGQLLSRRVNGKLEIKALDLNQLGSKTSEAQADAFRASLEEVADLMLKAGLVDARAADLLRRFMPTCTMNDRASAARKAARLVLRRALVLPDDGDDDPTCAEHGLVNILEEGRKAMDKVLREMMEITDAQAEGDAAKVKAMRTCVGWFSSPACALIYQVHCPPIPLHPSPSHGGMDPQCFRGEF